jgi:hypothetical protein
MRLAFCFLSNKEDGLRNLRSHIYYIMNTPPYVIDSYSLNLLINPPLQSDLYFPDWNVEYRQYFSFPVIDMFSMRQDSLAMARNAEFIFIGDDDMRFEEGSSEVINECCYYMIKNEDCGAIYLGGNFGGEGAKHGKEIYIDNKGYLGTNRGILVRNRPVMLDQRLHAPGANFDAALAFTCLMQGYYVARRLHVPIQHLTTNVMKENHPNQFYDLNYLRSQGIMSKVNEVIGRWTNHALWPTGIFYLYRQAAMRQGFICKYDEDGVIYD